MTVMGMSFLTEGLGLSNTLGAFLAGVLLSETKYRYQIEADIAPFRGILLGLFFLTVGFEIDLQLIATNFPVIAGIIMAILLIKAVVATAVCAVFGLSFANAQQAGVYLCQGGEFAFVTFGMARGLGILTPLQTKILLTSVAMTMAVTPALVEASHHFAKRMEENSGFTHYMGEDRDANEIKESEDFVVVIGYGTVGKLICELLDSKLIKYIGIEVNPNKAIEARNRGLPVFYGDITRPEVAEAFSVGKAKGCVVTISEKLDTNRAVITLRRLYPNLKIFARAKNDQHRERLMKTLDVVAMVPVLPEDSLLLTLPFGGAVLSSLGAPVEEVKAILETKRKEIIELRNPEFGRDDLLMLGFNTVGDASADVSAADMEGVEAEYVADREGEEIPQKEKESQERKDEIVKKVLEAGA
uniref:RCK N-terminal domain-containing protein n=1 Tax=Corethron hystrix TaxID=216773 RepID=A0A7S1FUH2_9STRA